MADSFKTETLQDRLDCLQELTDFTEKCKKQLQDIYETLGWSQDFVSNQEPMEQCPFDHHHRVPVRNMEKHKASCHLNNTGYSAEEQAQMCDPSVCYKNSSVRSFTMDKSTQHHAILKARSAAPLMKMEGAYWQVIPLLKFWGRPTGQYSSQPIDVPQNHKRAVCDLTVADRLALYDHVVEVLNKEKEASSSDDLYVDLVSKLQKDDGQDEPKTHLELMAEMRDYKRRRQSYRAKNVHITKKSYTEVIREVISVHSEELARQWRDEREDDAEEGRPKNSSNRHPVNEKRSASSESLRSHSKRRHSREGSREGRKKKKKRDSRSPDDHHHHHDRKKKKKKKKDARERSRSNSG